MVMAGFLLDIHWTLLVTFALAWEPVFFLTVLQDLFGNPNDVRTTWQARNSSLLPHSFSEAVHFYASTRSLKFCGFQVPSTCFIPHLVSATRTDH